jgi:hypothetical protein
MLCSEADAQAVADSIGPGTTIIPDPTYTNTTVNWGTETRRIYIVGTGGWNAAILRAMMTQQIFGTSGYEGGGVGAPGQWSFPSNSPTWTLIRDPGISVTASPIPTPCRSLITTGPSAETIQGIMGGGFQVIRTDLAPAQGPVSGGGGLNATQSAQLQFCHDVCAVMNVKYSLGVTPE